MPTDLLHKLNGHINALVADFQPVENWEKGFTTAATDHQDPHPSGPTDPRPAMLPCAAIRFIADNLRSRKPVANASRRRRSL
jgi:hypothetical protein